MLEVTTVPLQILADGIVRAFHGSLRAAWQLADGGRLLADLEAAGAQALRSMRYDSIDRVPDDEVLAAGTDARLWSSSTLLLAAQVSFQLGPFAGHCLSIRGPTTPAALLNYYHACVWGKLFDVEVVLLAQPINQLLIATHYGVVVLLEPPPLL